MKKSLLSFLLLLSITGQAHIIYFVSNDGNDSTTGNNENLVWLSLANESSTTLVAADALLLRRGYSWLGQLILQDVISNNKVTIYGMGDSTTSGDYPLLLQQRLGSNYKIVDKGLGGNTTSQMAARFETDVTKNGDADYVIIWGGINDISKNQSASSIKANLQTMYDSAYSNGIKVVAMTISPFGSSGWWTAARQAGADEVNAWILGRPSHIDFVVDTFSVLNDPSHPLSLRPEDTIDGLHFSASGNKRVLAAILASVSFNLILNNVPHS
jgi:lysophospholipase L1-like esterase